MIIIVIAIVIVIIIIVIIIVIIISIIIITILLAILFTYSFFLQYLFKFIICLIVCLLVCSRVSFVGCQFVCCVDGCLFFFVACCVCQWRGWPCQQLHKRAWMLLHRVLPTCRRRAASSLHPATISMFTLACVLLLSKLSHEPYL